MNADYHVQRVVGGEKDNRETSGFFERHVGWEYVHLMPRHDHMSGTGTKPSYTEDCCPDRQVIDALSGRCNGA